MARVIDTAAVEVRTDTRRAVRDAARGGRLAGRAFERAANRAARDIQVGFKLDEADLRRQLRGIEETVRVGVDFDVQDADLTRRLRDLQRETVTIPVDFDVQDATLDARLRDLAGETVTVTALVELADAQARAQLATLADEQLQIPAEVDLQRGALDAQLAEIRAIDLTLPAEVQVDDTQLDALRARIEATRPTVRVDVDVERPAPVIVPGRVVIDSEQIDRQLEQVGALRLGVDEAHIAAQVAAGIKAGEALAGDVDANVTTTNTARTVLDQTRMRALTRGLPPVRLRAILDTSGIGNRLRRTTVEIGAVLDVDDAVADELAGVEAYFAANPVKIRAVLDVDEQAGRAAIRRADTLVNDLGGPQSTLREQLDLDDTIDVDVRFVYRDPPEDVLERARRAVAEGRGGSSFDFLPTAEVERQARSVEVELDPSWPPRADSAARAEYEAWAASLPTAEIAAEVSQRSLATATARIENTLRDLTVDIDVRPDLDDDTLRARLRDLSRGITIPVSFRILDGLLRARLRALEATRINIPVVVGGLDQVEVRVTANTAALRAELERLGGYVLAARLALDTTAARAELERLDSFVLAARLDVDTAQARADIEGLGPFDVPARLVVDRQHFRGQIAGLSPVEIEARLRIDTAAARARLEAIGPVDIAANIDLNEAALAARIAAAVRAGITAGSIGSAGSIGGGAGGGGAGLGGLAGMAPAIAAALAIAPALAVAGAAVTAAWATVSTAIAAVPGVLALLAAPIATVALGFDGIKEAASTLQPEFEQLQSYINATFRNQLTPVFEQLRAVFPTLTVGIHDIAHSLTEAAAQAANFITSAQGMDLVEAILANVSTAIRDMTPGLGAISEALLTVASQAGAFDAVTEGVNRFGEAFRASVVDLLKDNVLQDAFSGLGDLLGSVSEAFVGLVENGIRTFATAAPGITSFLDELTAFFGRFDYAALGESVGGVFRGLGDALAGVPTDTFREIEDSFAGLSDVFQDADFQSDIQDMVAGIPAVIDEITALTDAFADIGGKLSIGLQALNDAGTRVEDFGERIMSAADRLNEGVPQQLTDMFLGLDDILDRGFEQLTGISAAEWDGVGTANEQGAALAATRGRTALDTGFDEMSSSASTGLAGVTSAAAAEARTLAPAVDEAFAPVPETVLAILQQVAPIIEQSFGGLGVYAAMGMAQVATTIQSSGIVIANGLRLGLTELPAIMTTALGQVSAVIPAATAPWAAAMTTGVGGMREAVTIGMTGIQQGVVQNLSLINATIAAQTAPWAATMTAGIGGVREAVTIGFVGIQLGVVQNLSLIDATIAAQTAPWAATMATGVAGMRESVTIGFVGIQQGFVQNLALIDATILAGTASWATSLTTGMVGMQAAVAIGFTGIQSAVAQNLALVNLSIIQGTVMWSTSITAGMVGMSAAVSLGFTGVQSVVAQNLALINLAIIQGSTFWAQSIAVGMVGLGAAVSVGFAGVQSVVAQNLALINLAIIQGTGIWAQTFLVGMTNLAAASTAGWAAVQAAAAAGMALVNQTIAVGAAAWAISIAAGLVGLAGAVTAGFAGLAAGASAGMATVNAIIVTGGALWAASMGSGFLAINAQVSVGFAAVGAAVSVGMAAGNAAIIAGMAAWAATVAASMAQITSAVTVGNAAIVASAVQAMAALRTAVQAGMTGAVSAVTGGMTLMVSAVRGGTASAVAAANAGAGQMRAAGSNMGAALAAGLNSQLGAVQAAAARLANAAAAATRAAAAIRSPSRVFTSLGDYMGQGLAAGLEGSEDRIIATATTLVDRIVAETSRLGDGVATAGERAVVAATRQVSQLSEAGRAAQEILNHINSGGSVFEDFSFYGNSDLVRRLNDVVGNAFYEAGNSFEIPAMRRYLADFIARERQTAQPVVAEVKRDDACRAMEELRETIAGLVTALARSGDGGQLVADEVRQQTGQLVRALREVPPASAAERRVLAETGAW